MRRRILLVSFLGFAGVLAALFPAPTAHANVELVYFRAESDADLITLEWETASELDNLGFNILRAESANVAQAQALNATMIPSQVGGQPTGAYYQWQDESAQANTTYFYWLQDVDFSGNIVNHGPVEAALAGGSLIPTVGPTNTPSATTAATNTPQPTSTPTTTPNSSDQAAASATSSPIPFESPISTPISAQTVVEQPSTPFSGSTSQGDPAYPVATELGNSSSVPVEQPSQDSLNRPGSADLPTQDADVPRVVDGVVSSTPTVQAVADSVGNTLDEKDISSQAQVLSGDGSGNADTPQKNEAGGSSFNQTRLLALVVLTAAVLLGLVAVITLWLVLQTRSTNSNDE